MNYHVINMRSRFPKPQEPGARASWLTRPLFKRVAPGQYMLLTEAELAWFRNAVARGEPLVFRDEYTRACASGWKRTTSDSVAVQAR